MPIQLIITGDHTTDVLAEVKALADATGISAPQVHVRTIGKPVPAPQPVGIDEVTKEKIKKENEAAAESETEEKTKKLGRGDHKREADKMIAAGEKDEKIFPLLSKKQQERVTEALEAVVEEPKEEETIDGLFDDDDDQEEEKEITIDDLRSLIESKCRDEDENDLPEAYAAVRQEMRKVIPEDKKISVSNIPQNKIAKLYAAIENIDV